MLFKEVIENTSTLTELKRTASAYVIDYRNLSNEEILSAIQKTAPQYYFEENVKQTLKGLTLSQNREDRVLGPMILRYILLHCDDNKIMQSELSLKIIEYEQSIINSATDLQPSKIQNRENSYELFTYVLEAAWEHNADISCDERNLLDKIREKLSLTEEEHHILEASIGKFPNPNNTLHTRNEIERVRRRLQGAGILFAVRDEDKNDYDILPEEVANSLKELLGIEMKEHGYRSLIKYKAVHNKTYLLDALKKNQIHLLKNIKLNELEEICLKHVSPSILLGGITPRDGLDISSLGKWLSDLGEPTTGQKTMLINRIIQHYDNLRQDISEIEDERVIWFEYYEDLAQRALENLRTQNILIKDLECEKKFEIATDYIFEELLFHKPLVLKGTEHADGMLAYQDKLVLWDNKSKESPVNLNDHISQFDRYVKKSERQIPIFLVIGPSFTEHSVSVAMNYMIQNDTTISLITAEDLKKLSLSWAKKHANKKESFPLGYFKQPGRFNLNLVDL